MKQIFAAFWLFLMLSANVFAQTSDEAATLKLSIKLDDPTDLVRVAAFSPDATKILLINKLSIQIRSAENGELLQTFPDGVVKVAEITNFAWQPSGAQVVLYGNQLNVLHFGKNYNPNAFLWNVENGKITAVLSGKDKNIRFARWNKAGDKLLTSNFFLDEISLWNQNGKLLIQRRAKSLKSIKFTNDGDNLLISQTIKKQPVEIWSADTLTPVKSFSDNKISGIRDVYASPNEQLLCGAISNSKGVACWETSDEARAKFLFLDNETTRDNSFLGFSGDSNSFAVTKSSGGKVEIFDSASGKIKNPLVNFKDARQNYYISSPNQRLGEQTAWSANDQFFVVNTNDAASIYKGKTGDFITDIALNYQTQTTTTERTVTRQVKKSSSSKSKSGNSSKSGGKKGKDEYETVFETEYDTSTEVVDYETLFFNPSKQLLLTVSNYSARIWNLETGKTLQFFGVADNQRRVAQWNLDGNLLLTAENDASVSVWEISPSLK